MRLLCIDEDHESTAYLEQILPHSWVVHKAHTSTDVNDAAPGFPFDLVIVDVDFEHGHGMDFLSELIRWQGLAPVIAVSCFPKIELAVRSIRYGASEYFTKPLTRDQILKVVNRIKIFKGFAPSAVRTIFRTEIEMIRSGYNAIQSGLSYNELGQIRAVFLGGEAGTGKYRLARDIHETDFCEHDDSLAIRHRFFAYGGGDRSLEQQTHDLFGTDLDIWKLGKSSPGIFERAGKGTVYIAEIAAIKKDVQLAIFHMLEDSHISRFMGRSSFRVFCRLILASVHSIDYLLSHDLLIPELAAFFRYQSIHLRPLRHRTDEIIPMAWYYLRTAREIFPRAAVKSFHPRALESIIRHSWPENLRELRNSLIGSIINCPEEELKVVNFVTIAFETNGERDNPEP